MSTDANNTSDGGSGSGGSRRGSGRPAGNRSGGRGSGAPSGGSRGRGGQGGGRPNRPGGGSHQSPVEAAAKATRNALRRHAESVRDDQSRLACRVVLTGIVGVARRSSSPGEALMVAEQVMHVVESSHPDFSQIPTTLRATTDFAAETPRRAKDVTEMLRLLLRHGYSLAADHIPRQARDDGPFRATALIDSIAEVGADYLSDEALAAATK